MKDSDIYNLNKSLYEIHSKDILRAISEINKLYIGFDGDKKVFQNTIVFEKNGKEIWLPNNEGHEHCHIANEYKNGYVFFIKIFYPNHALISRNAISYATMRLYLAFQYRLTSKGFPQLDGYPDVDFFTIYYNRGLDKWHGLSDVTEFTDLKIDEAINKLRKIILDHSKIIEKSRKKYWG
jgi:hypothetical protein